MSELLDFQPWPKTPRYTGTRVTITEKIDGTNAQVCIARTDLGARETVAKWAISRVESGGDAYLVFAGSRNRWLAPNGSIDEEKATDNFGFAHYVRENAEGFVNKLGEGRHFGEWFGAGIQRRYGLEEKRFALFNTGRWQPADLQGLCTTVPHLYTGPIEGAVEAQMALLSERGSSAVEGFMQPEGIVLYHHSTRSCSKVTFEHSKGKWASKEETAA